MYQDISLLVTYFMQTDIYLLLLFLFIFDIPRYLLATFASIFIRPWASLDSDTYQPKVSVIISVHNATQNFITNLQAIKTQTLKPFEIIVVNDGSTNETAEILQRGYKAGLIDSIITHSMRCGKSASINHAVRFARGELILNLDDDTLLKSTTLHRLSLAFRDPKVAIASGSLFVRNKDESLVTSLQAIEYMTSMAEGRFMLNLFDAVSCCSGALSMFRRSIYMAIGGNNVGPGEDLELTMRLRKLKFKIAFIHDAQASILGPSTFLGLIKQRLRWDRDSLCIRVNMYKELSLHQFYEANTDVLARMDFIIFEFIPTLIFPFYLIYIFMIFGNLFFIYLFSIYILVLGFYIVNIALVMLIFRYRLNLFDLAALLIFPLYQGIIMKLVRFIAFSSEILFSTSHDDDYVPKRIRHALYDI